MKRFLAFAVIALATPVMAQDWKGVGRLQGQVTGSDGKPVAGASVKLDCAARGGGTAVTTDKKGKWAYLGLAGCRWELEVSAEGFATKAFTVNMPSDQMRMPPVDVQLDKPKGPPPELMAAVKNGDEAFAAKNWAVARENYEKILEMRPELGPQVYQKLAQAYAGEKNSAKVIEYLEKSIMADPSRTDLRFMAAQSALEADLKEKGMEFLAGIDDAVVKGPDGYFNLAVYFLRSSDVPNAITYFTKAIAKDDKLGDAYYWRGMSYLRENKLGEAKVDMQKVLDLDPAGQYAEKAKGILEQLKAMSGS
ncbi:MAG: tetratricopeptide repeat protein [Vicinamibacteria bacterium]|nr:tetratricopeptide repeat protein [Vicinamibacteria bacterium]